uniref:hypothetical protein n=1 Tax=Acetatifactor sp. TaxID=1872090 RepID=UPI004056AF8E
MQISNYWKQFEHTGRVEDYLSYVAEDTFVPLKSIASSEIPAGTRILGEVPADDETGVNPYAGIHMGNGNDFKTDAYRGI